MAHVILTALFSVAVGAVACGDNPPTMITQWGTSGFGIGQFDWPQGAALGLSGEVFVADRNNNRIQVFTDEGQYLRSWGSFGNTDGLLSGPTGLARAANGSLYVVDFPSRIQIFGPDGTFLGRVPHQPGVNLLNPRSIAFGPDGNLWVANTLNNEVLKLSPQGVLLARASTRWGPTNWVAVNSRGEALVVDNNLYIERYASDGTLLGFFGPWSPFVPRGSIPFFATVAVDRDDNVYVGAEGGVGDRCFLYKLNSSGDLLATWGTPGAGPGEVGAVAGIAVADLGDIFVVDIGNARVERFRFVPTSVPTRSWGHLKHAYRAPR